MKLVAIGLFALCSTIGYGILADWPDSPSNLNETHGSKASGIAAELSNFLRFPLLKVHAKSPQPQPDQEPEEVDACDQPEVAPPPPPLSVDTHALIRQAALKHNVPVAFVTSIVAAESNFNCAAISPRGAIGPMQLMPDLARQFGIDPKNPAQNIDAGTHYLRILLDRYRRYRDCMKRAIAAYNAGPTVVDRCHGVPPYKETRNYVSRVLAYLRQFQHGRS